MTLETVVFKFCKAIEAAKANHEPGIFFWEISLRPMWKYKRYVSPISY